MARAQKRDAGSSPVTQQTKNKTMENLEKTVSEAILQLPTDKITIDGEVYPLAPATVGTVIMLSGLIAELPKVDKAADNIVLEMLHTAKDCGVIGRITATLILGAKRIKENRQKTIYQVTSKKHWWSPGKEKRRVAEVDYLAERITNELTIDTLVKFITRRLGLMQIGSFFELTTFLSEANQLRRTREVETASGD